MEALYLDHDHVLNRKEKQRIMYEIGYETKQNRYKSDRSMRMKDYF
jgi:hypothetical protein